MTYKKLLDPLVLFSTSVAIFITIFFLFEIKIFGSFLITERELNVLGLLHLLLLITLQMSSIMIIKTIKFPVIKQLKISSEKLTDILIILFTLLSAYGLYKGVLVNLPVSILSSSFWLLTISNKFRSNIVWGEGFTILNTLSIVALSVSTYLYEKKLFYKILTIINLIILILGAFAYSARLKIVIAICILVVSFIRRKKYTQSIKWVPIILGAIVLVAFLVWGGGIRGVDIIGKHFTSSSFLWSIYSFTDYFVSTVLFQTYGLAQKPGEINFWAIQDALGPYEIHGYTNIGRYAYIYQHIGYFTYVYIICTSILVALAWKSFNNGKKAGQLLYPFLVYVLLEGLRIEPLLVRDFYIPFIILVIITPLVPENSMNNDSTKSVPLLKNSADM